MSTHDQGQPRPYTALADFHPPMPHPNLTSAHDRLFTSPAEYGVQTTMERHDTKKRSGSSDGAHTYDTPIT
ncbi:hypothetical protein [Streptosporangium sandarakinum]|uniref:hypothetical protein n=1 Tax=Streptosporangium sandarakinum TaxID=1260955 RepID=UPI0037B66614